MDGLTHPDLIGAAEAVARGLIKKHNDPANETFTDAVSAFISAVDWTEPFILGAFGFHCAFITAAFLLRKNWSSQMLLLCLSLALVYSAEFINDIARNNWTLFSSQQYFDRSGIFISAILSGPLLLSSFFILLYGLYQASSLVIQVKRLEVQRDRRQRTKKATSSETSSNNSSAPHISTEAKSE